MTDADPDRNRDPRVPPPTRTEWSPEVGEEGGSRPLPPFFAGAREPAEAEPEAPARPDPPPEPWAPEAVEEPWRSEAPPAEAARAEAEGVRAEGAGADEPFPFEEVSGPAVAEPRGGEGVEDFPVEEPVTAHAGTPRAGVEQAGVEEEDDFPVEAFNLPGLRSGPGPVPAAAPGGAAAGDGTTARALDLADRLDRLAGALRARGMAALTDQLAGGDRFDAVLTGLLAGFLAARED
ncbi:MAG TPA: hypothetical protein VJ957_05730 [Longimicrobiales bacterium]|nr:hypothetical protein [Longimicrobiales bacterium]